MSKKFKVVVAGAGPGGCIFARDLARTGIDVTVYEKGEYETMGHDWSDAVERKALSEVGLDVPEESTKNTGALVKKPGAKDNAGKIFEEHAYPDMEAWAPDYSCRKMIKFRYITTDRRALGKLLVDQARDAGAEIKFGHEVVDIVISGGSTLGNVTVCGVKVKNLATGEEAEVSADVVADDTGFKARLRTKLPTATGIADEFNRKEFANVHRTVRRRNKEVNDFFIDHYRYGYHTGYQWVQFLNDEEIDTGAGVRADPANPDPKDIVAEFISRHPSISDNVVRGGQGLCLVGRSPCSLVAGGFVTIGDAAGQTIPMTGCGAGGAMAGGKFAAEVVLRAAEEGKNDIAALWPYNWNWFVGSGRGANYAGLTALRNILQDLSHEDISFLFRKDIMNAEMLSASINGSFTIPDLQTMVQTLLRGISRPALLIKLNKATTLGTKILKHYREYPRAWDPVRFETWRAKAEDLFGKTQ
ncbi:MAG: hypothetical protein JW920_04485 [Deltaproteobacteria bacterium]|nr:hypothetical protein [Deltaproteobacteria bacterium]